MDIETQADSPPFGACLMAARLAAGLSPTDVARISGMLRSNVYRVESGRRSVSWAWAYRFITACGLDLSYFFPDDLILQAAESIRDRQRRDHKRTEQAETN